jgi:LPS-assembly protein
MRGPMGFKRTMFAVLSATAILAFSAGGALAEDAVQERVKELSSVRQEVSIQADKVEFDRNTGIYKAEGGVRITQGSSTLTADKATLDSTSGESEAEGRALLVTDGNILYADSIRVNFNTKLGVIQQGRLFIEDGNFHITGDELQRVKEDEFQVQGGGLTTCDAATPFWKVTAKKLDVRMDKDVTGSDVVFRLKDVPVFYTPYAWFPLLKPRTTGLLIPSVGFSSKEGVRMFESFYWAPRDNFDATFNLDYRGKRGTGLGLELRQAQDKDTDTRFYGYYMDDRKDKKERYNLLLRHRQLFSEAIAGKLDLNLSDRRYFKDLTETALERTQRSIDSNLFITDKYDWGRTYLFAQYTEALDLNNDVTVQRLPEAGFNIIKKQLNGLPVYLDVDGSADYFYKKVGISSARADAMAKMTGDFNVAGINFSPRLGYRETAYDPHGFQASMVDDERGLFGAGLKVQTGFNRLYHFESGSVEGVRHTLEPVISYNLVSRRGGKVFPVYDEVDTYSRKNQVAYSVANRFVIKYRGAEGQPQRVDYCTFRLSQYYDAYKDLFVLNEHREFSNLFGEVVYKTSTNFTLNNDFRYDIYTGGLLSINTDIRYDAPYGRWYGAVGQRFSRDVEQTFISPTRFDFFTPNTNYVSDFVVSNEEQRLNFLTAEAGGTINKNWQVSGKVWYDVHKSGFRETDASVIYSAQCWGITVKYINRPGERSLLATLNLKGIGNVKL